MGIYAGSLIGLLLIACAILLAGRAFANENIRGPLLDALTGIAIARFATELPRVKTRGAFISFVIGAILFSALILLSEAYRL